MGFEEDIKNSGISVIMTSKENYQNNLNKIIKASADASSTVCYLCVNRPYAAVSDNISKNNLGSEKFFYIDTLTKNVQAPPQVDNCIFVSAPNALTEISVSITKAITEHNCNMLLVDSLSSFLVYEKPHSLIQFIHSVITKLRVNNAKAVMIALNEDLNSELVKDLHMFVDKVIEMQS